MFPILDQLVQHSGYPETHSTITQQCTVNRYETLLMVAWS